MKNAEPFLYSNKEKETEIKTAVKVQVKVKSLQDWPSVPPHKRRRDEEEKLRSYKTVKQSRNRPSVAQRVPGGLGSQIFMTFGIWRWWGLQPHAPVAFAYRKSSWYSFSLWAETIPRAMVRSEEICHWKIQWHHRELILGFSY